MHMIQLIIFIIAYSSAAAQPQQPNSHITILGSVYCDVCHDHSLSKHSHFLQGVDVNIECKFKTISKGHRKHISFSVNKTTDIYGIYKLDMPSVEGINCSEFLCRARLIRQNSVSECNVGSTKHASNEITIISKQNNVCIYTLGALSYNPPTRNATLCGNQRMGLDYSFNSSKFFFPFFPPFVFTWPPFPQLPPLPQLPPFPQLPPLPALPPFPSFPLPWPYPYQWSPNPPSLPFPFPPLPPFSAPPALNFPNPPPVNLADPRIWIPNIPFSPPPPEQLPPLPPGVNWDPRTWIPHPPPMNPSSQNP